MSNMQTLLEINKNDNYHPLLFLINMDQIIYKSALIVILLKISNEVEYALIFHFHKAYNLFFKILYKCGEYSDPDKVPSRFPIANDQFSIFANQQFLKT